MTLAVVLVEIMHISQLTKFKRYVSYQEWLQERWDNLAVSFISGVLLCVAFSEVSLFLEDYFNTKALLHNYPYLGGLVIGLSSTPIINWIMKKTKAKLNDNQ